MNRTKTIYFLSAIVMIIGCYALNLSYSLFVQTEEKEIISSTVPELAYNLELQEIPSTSTYSLRKSLNATTMVTANTSKYINLIVNNNSKVDLNYGILLTTTAQSDDINVQLVDIYENDIIGMVKSNDKKTISLYITNSSSSDQTLDFVLEAKYATLNLESEKYMENTIIDRTNKHQVNLSTQILTLDNRITKNEGIPNYDSKKINEIGMYSTEDDLGTSWYIHGINSYNYVNFANMCWRIVRIDGENNAKIILEDATAECNNEKFTGNWNIGETNFTNQVSALQTWYNSNIKDYESYLKQEKICLGDTTTKYNETTNTYGDSIYNYSVYQRIHSKTPTLKCDSYSSDLTYIYPITADEAYFSGLTTISDKWDYYYKTSYNYLLNEYQVANDLSFWTASKAGKSFNAEYAYRISKYGQLADLDQYGVSVSSINSSSYSYYDTNKEETLTTTFAARPMLTILSEIKITDGNGTKEKPYTVE